MVNIVKKLDPRSAKAISGCYNPLKDQKFEESYKKKEI